MRVLYGIRSGGLGHYSRSKLVVDHLISKGHKVKVITAGRVYDLMASDYDVEKVSQINPTLKGNYLKNDILKKNDNPNEKFYRLNKKIKDSIEKFNPDIAISDNETFTTRFASINKIPTIYLGNAYTLTHTHILKSTKEISGPFVNGEKFLFNIVCPDKKHVESYITTSFFDVGKHSRNKLIVVPSLIRDEIIKLKNSKIKDYILVYQTKYYKTKIDKKLTNVLKSVPNEKFIIYGFDVNKKDRNLQFKKTNVDNSFMSDLAGAKAIITNGGFSLMSEGIFLGKPILSRPINSVEQKLNAIQLEKLDYGKYAKRLTPDAIKAFLYDIDFYKKNLKNYKQKNNSVAFNIIDLEIKKAMSKNNSEKGKSSPKLI